MITGPLTTRFCAYCLMPSSYMAQLPHTLFLHALPLCFVFVCQFCRSAAVQPFSLCVCSPRGIPLSFCIPLSPSVSLHPSSWPPPAPFVSHSNPRFIYSPLFYFLSQMCVFFSLPLQWSYGFYLTHNQGQSGFEFFFKTKELKKKWLEQFGMAM